MAASTSCPLRGQDISQELLATLIERALQSLQKAAVTFEEVRQEFSQIASSTDSVMDRVAHVARRGSTLGIEFPPVPASPGLLVRQAVEHQEPFDASALVSFHREVADWRERARASLDNVLPVRPVGREGMLIDIGAMVADARSWRTAREAEAVARRSADSADQLFGAYQTRQREYFEAILSQTSGRVASIYESLHPGEGLGQVQVEMWTERGVELAIEFHGSRQRPPHGVLSESHLNSLAIALFLAMAESFNEELGFLVLDDVVNSFDLVPPRQSGQRSDRRIRHLAAHCSHA